MKTLGPSSERGVMSMAFSIGETLGLSGGGGLTVEKEVREDLRWAEDMVVMMGRQSWEKSKLQEVRKDVFDTALRQKSWKLMSCARLDGPSRGMDLGTCRFVTNGRR